MEVFGNLNTGLGLNFDRLLQEGTIQNHAVRMLHEIAVSCTCQAGDSFSSLREDGKDKRSQPFCPRCAGEGILYRDAEMISGIATNMRQQTNIVDSGIVEPGDLILSPGAPKCRDRRIGQWDKLTATWPQTPDKGQVIVRGAGTTGETALSGGSILPTEDRLWYEPVSAIWCEDDSGKTYSENGDFELGPGRIIRWIGAAPVSGQKYTFKYNALFEWVAFLPPQERRDRGNLDLGPLVFLRKRHVVFLNQSSIPVDADRIPLQARITC